MIRIHMSAENLMQTRFAFSPLWEVVASFRALTDAARHALHLPWMTSASKDLRGLDLNPVWALVRPEGYIPDFLTPPTATPFPDFSAEIERLRQTEPQRVREEVTRLVGQNSQRDRELKVYLDDPHGAVERLAEALLDYHERVIAPHWPPCTPCWRETCSNGPEPWLSKDPRRCSRACTGRCVTARGSSR